ncbi:MAG TPA: cytochrome c [Anaerolineae bacterium]|nr:cytochrome c [Anaerolineae bacterium]
MDLRVEQLRQSGDVDVASTDAYYQQYPHVLEAVELFGGKRTVMPNLALKPDEIAALTAFFNYAAEIDTAGWPPARQADAAVVERLQAEFGVVPPTAVETAPTPASPVSLEVQGKQLAGELGCLACHSTDGTQRSGPTFKGLFGATVPLQDGSTVIVDEAYLRESILGPNAKIRQGFSAGSMPAYEGRVSPAEIDALIAYIKSLK